MDLAPQFPALEPLTEGCLQYRFRGSEDDYGDDGHGPGQSEESCGGLGGSFLSFIDGLVKRGPDPILGRPVPMQFTWAGL